MTRSPGCRGVLVLTGGLIHLVHQLAVVGERPELTQQPTPIGVLITGVLSRDLVGLADLQEAMEQWFDRLRQQSPGLFSGLKLIREADSLQRGEWRVACLNNQWQESQRSVVERLAIPTLVVCGDGLGLYYRCAREVRAILPSLLGLPIREPGRQVHYALSGRQPWWHRPPLAAAPAPAALRAELFTSLVASQRSAAGELVATALASTPAERPLWLLSVPNLAHQFPGHRLPQPVLDQWRRQLERPRPGRRSRPSGNAIAWPRGGGDRFDPARDQLVLIDHPKAPLGGSFSAAQPDWIRGPLRSTVPLEVLVRLLQEAALGRPIVVAGLTSALYGVSALTGARVVWLGLGPLWSGNPHYRRKPLEFLHRLLRVRRMALLTSQLLSDNALNEGEN